MTTAIARPRAADAATPRLSVNLDKIALLRNTRQTGAPNVLDAARLVVAAGAHGITVHPRPDGRHILPADVRALRALVRDAGGVELNVEGNPFPEFMQLMRETVPHQATLVPDDVDVKTSDRGWPLAQSAERLAPLIAELKELGIRVSLFMDAEGDEWQRARSLGADCVELYTEPFARAVAEGRGRDAQRVYTRAAERAQAAGLAVHAGHDLDLENLGLLCTIPGLREVSIGHALIADALRLGLGGAVRAYLTVLAGTRRQPEERIA